jgi:hypothetical protein
MHGALPDAVEDLPAAVQRLSSSAAVQFCDESCSQLPSADLKD